MKDFFISYNKEDEERAEGHEPELISIQNPAAKLDHAKREIIAARFFEIPAETVEQAASSTDEILDK